MKRFALVPISIALVACGGPTRSPAEPPPHGDARIADPTPVQHTDTDLAFQGIHMEPPEFIEDDYAGALAKAKAAHVPLFVDSWATWCHSCLSMKQFVFTSPVVGQEAPKFVWLSIDTENTKNAAFLAKFPNNAIPTLRVIDPSTENATWTWEGTMTAAELAAALEHVRGAV
ncbi:MAG: thioredoxin family protein, partial [Polyangiaceae bacterium]